MNLNKKAFEESSQEIPSFIAKTDLSKVAIVKKLRLVFNKGDYQSILLINPLQFPEEKLNVRIAKNKRYYDYPPYNLGLLSANLKKRGYTVNILDLNMEMLDHICTSNEESETIKEQILILWKEKLEKKIRDSQPDLIGITCTFTMSHVMTIKVADYVKDNHANLPIIAGGVHITNASEIVLKEGKSIDFISLYESDQSFCNLLDFVNGKTSEEKLTQLATLIDDKYLSLSDRIFPNGEDMNVIPDYLDLPLEKYDSLGEIGTFRYWRPKNSKASTSLSNRGCRARCSFCSVRNFNGNDVRSRSPESVVDEIEELVTKHDISHITWLDDDLFYDAPRTIRLFNEIKDRKLNITWDASNGIIVSAAVVSPQLVQSAAESGCIGMYFGIESGNPEILRKIHKPSGVRHYLKLGKLMEQFPQIFTRGFLIIGFPNETFGQMLDTVKIAQAMKLDWCTVQLLTPLPNTEIYNEMVDEGLIKEGSLNISSDGFTMFSVRESERQRLQELKEQTNAKNFSNFLKKNLDVVPTKPELDDLWFLIDYKVNYEKIFTEDNPIRIEKMKCFLSDISNRMSIDNPLSTLFLGIVEEKLGNIKQSKENFALSEQALAKSKYWQNRFEMLELVIPA